VLREADGLYEGRGRLSKTYSKLAQRLAELNIPHALVGGYALIVHGVRRFTENVDLLIAGDGLREALLGRGYVPIPGSSRNMRDAETGVRLEFLVAGQYPGDGKPKPVAFPDPSAVVRDMQGVKVVDLKTLIELKLASGMTGKGRLQDLADVQRLIQTHSLGSEYAEELDASVRRAFLELLE